MSLFFRYNRVVEVCSLRADFDILPYGDQTEVRRPPSSFRPLLKHEDEKMKTGLRTVARTQLGWIDGWMDAWMDVLSLAAASASDFETLRSNLSM